MTWWLPPFPPGFYHEANLTAPDPLEKPERYKTTKMTTWGQTPKISVNPRFWYDTWPNKPFYAVDVLMVSNPSCQDCPSTSPVNMATAVRCNLDPCVKGYRAEVKNGVYSEWEDKRRFQFLRDTISAEEEPPLGDSHIRGWVLATNTSLVDGQERPCVATHHWEPGSVRVDFYANRSLGISQFSFTARESKPDSKLYRQECVWALDGTTWTGLGFSLDKFLRAEGNGTFNGKIGMVEGPMWLKEMYASGSGNISTVEAMVRGLANAMTAAIRNKPYGNLSANVEVDVEAALQPSLSRSRGTMSSMQTCVNVHWGWIAYPAALLALQWVFSIMVSTRRYSGAAWKSSPLALLFHGLDDNLRKKHSHLDTVKDMNRVAGDIDVQLAPFDDPKGKDWRLCET